MDCLSPEEVDGYLVGGLSPAAFQRVEGHLDKCSACRQLVGKLAQATGSAELADTLAGSHPTEPSAPFAKVRVVTKIDRYVVKRQLGAGGMGVVYVATDSELGRDVAIKVLRSGADAERLRREAQALARLDHPNVVAVYDVGEHEGGVFVAMALVDGTNLREWLSHEHTTEEILRVLVSAARGIIAAHEAGMIHRDLKPDNIFVASDGKVLVGDFGLARPTDGEDGVAAPVNSPAHSLTQTGSVLGTPAYMAPEQAAGEAIAASDQFSFCVTAYEALYGTRPFVGNTLEEVITNVESGEVAKPKRARDVPARVRAAIRRGLAADPAQRFPSMAALVAELEPRARRRWPYAVAGGAAIAIGATVFALARGDRDPAAACASTKTAIDGVWNAKQREALAAKLAQTIRPESAKGIADGYATYASRWSELRHTVCMERETNKLPAETAAAQERCLDLDRLYLEVSIDAVIANKGLADVDIEWRRVGSLPAIEACRSPEVVRLAIAGREHAVLMREAFTLASSYNPTLAAFAELRERAEAVKDQPAQLEIALSEARRAIELNATPEADAAIERAVVLAETLDNAPARVRALAISARHKCRQGVDAKVALDLADVASRRLDEQHHAIEIDELLQAKAQCATKLGRYEDAAAAYRKLTDRIVVRYGPDNMLAIEPRGALALMLQQLGKSEEAAKESAEVSRVISLNGGDAAAAAMSTNIAASNAFTSADLPEAIRLQRRAVDQWAAVPDVPVNLRTQALEQLAMYYEVDGAWAAAAATYDEIQTLLPAPQTSPELELVRGTSLVYRGNARLYSGNLDGAADDFVRALAIVRPLDQTELVAIAELGLGRIHVAKGAWLRGAKQIREGLATHAKVPASAFRIGMAELALAQAEWALGDKAASRETARKAERDIAKGVDDARAVAVAKNQVPWREAKLAEVVRWRDEHR